MSSETLSETKSETKLNTPKPSHSHKYFGDAKDRKFDTLTQFFTYCEQDRLQDVIESMEKHKFTVHTNDGKKMRTGLMRAASYGALQVCKHFIDLGAPVNISDAFGVTPLMYASRCTNMEIFQLLLDAGARLDARDKNNWSVAEHAARGGNVEIVKMIVSKWKPYKESSNNAKDKQRDLNDWNALVIAGSRGRAILEEDKRTPQSENNGLVDDGMHVLHVLLNSRPKLTVHALINRVHFLPETIGLCCENAVAKSSSPILLCLVLFENFKQLAKEDNGHTEALLALADRFADVAVKLFNDLSSDHICAWMLEERPGGANDEHDSAIEVALRSRNRKFLSNARVSRIANFWWTNTWAGFFFEKKYMMALYPSGDFTFQWLDTLLHRPWMAFGIPKTQYLLKVISFLGFLGILSAMAAQQIGVNEEFQPIEYVLYLYSLGMLLDEVVQVFEYTSIFEYMGKNIGDVYTCICMIIAFICRVSEQESPNPSTVAEVFYVLSIASITVITWFRVLFMLRHFDTVRPLVFLLIILKNMVLDIRNWVALLAITICGFFFAFRFVLGSESYQLMKHDQVRDSFLSLYQTALNSDIDFPSFQSLSPVREAVAQALGCFYLAVSAIILINLLIAMLSHTFEEVKEASHEEVLLSKVSNTWSHASSRQARRLTVSPFNLFVVGFTIPTIVVLYIWDYCKGRKEEVVTDKWLCVRCGADSQNMKDKFNEKIGQGPNAHRPIIFELVSCISFKITDYDIRRNAEKWLNNALGQDICLNCLRMKRRVLTSEETWFNTIMTAYSYFFFIALFYIPVFILTSPLILLSYLYSSYLKYVDSKSEKSDKVVKLLSQQLLVPNKTGSGSKKNDDNNNNNNNNNNNSSTNLDKRIDSLPALNVESKSNDVIELGALVEDTVAPEIDVDDVKSRVIECQPLPRAFVARHFGEQSEMLKSIWRLEELLKHVTTELAELKSNQQQVNGMSKNDTMQSLNDATKNLQDFAALPLNHPELETGASNISSVSSSTTAAAATVLPAAATTTSTTSTKANADADDSVSSVSDIYQEKQRKSKSSSSAAAKSKGQQKKRGKQQIDTVQELDALVEETVQIRQKQEQEEQQ